MDTSGRLYDDFIRLLFLHAHREASVLANELPEESDQFHFLRVVCFANLKETVGLIMTKSWVMQISIPLDLSSQSFIPLNKHSSCVVWTEHGGKSMREGVAGVKRGVGRRERMKHGKGTKDRDERSRGIEIRKDDVFSMIKPRQNQQYPSD